MIIIDPKDPTGEKVLTPQEKEDLKRIKAEVKLTQANPPRRGSWERPDPSTIPPGICWCGCGEPLVLGSQAHFKPGHQIRDPKYRKEVGMTANIVEINRLRPEGMPRRHRRRLISRAYRSLMEKPYPGDPLKRTGADILALAMFKAAVEDGDVMAAKEIADRVEGKADQQIDIDIHNEDNLHERFRLLTEKLRGNVIDGETVQPALGSGEAGICPDDGGTGEGPVKE
jgi:hypothetical protein